MLNKYEISLFKLLNRKEYEVSKSDEETLLEITSDLKKSKQFKEFTQKIEDKKIIEEYKRGQQVPMMKPFLSAANLQDSDENSEE